ncbi:MucR family transcriptional regulator [Novosphingobium sp. PhB165]|uniref:MucR family transcriptional regulator n=1 Tax=Novosphingobium sp. PhB165 TaxID=2485105 RepID=UPI0010453264|nr:MucR family transcriptional regulator [Novosphingobium sp. PhB165]TCM14003.1 MucR family transcriptional regulator [Novosphingobium sp. PhB165]
MTDEAILALAADIVTAHATNNTLPAEQLPRLIEAVYGSLAPLGKAPEPVEARTPAVSIRASVKPDGITCLECGVKLQTMKRHLDNEHQLAPEEYKRRWSLPAEYPLIAPAYAERRKQIALSLGLGRKPGIKAKPEAAACRDEVELTAAGLPEGARLAPRARKKLGIAAGDE